MAEAQASEVLPTPPLPVKNKKRVGAYQKTGERLFGGNVHFSTFHHRSSNLTSRERSPWLSV